MASGTARNRPLRADEFPGEAYLIPPDPALDGSDAGATMSKGLDKRKEQKKKPAKTLEEKRAAKRAKREGRQFPGSG